MRRIPSAGWTGAAALVIATAVVGCGRTQGYFPGVGAATSGSTTGGPVIQGAPDGGRCRASTLFAPAVNYSIGFAPFGIVSADFNGDGKPDLAVSDNAVDTAWILLGAGDGTFGKAEPVSEGGQSFWLTTADFNRDGIADLAVANGIGTVSVLIGDGRGGFGGPRSFSAGPGPNCVVAADFNGDGQTDVAVSNYGGNGTVSVMLGQANGSFTEPDPYFIGENAIFVLAGDFNGDGIPDLLAAAQSETFLSLLLGQGDGTFSQAEPFGASAGSGPTAIAVGEFNRSGSLGAAVSDWFGNSVAVLAGPVTAATQPQIIGLGSSPNSVAVADFDGDGILDLAVAEAHGFSSTEPGTVDLLIGKGNGTFAPAVPFAVGPSSVTVIAADLNGDGRPDLAVADQSGSVSILLNGCR